MQQQQPVMAHTSHHATNSKPKSGGPCHPTRATQLGPPYLGHPTRATLLGPPYLGHRPSNISTATAHTPQLTCHQLFYEPRM